MKKIQIWLLAMAGAALLTLTPGCFINVDDDEDIFGCVNGDGPVVTEDLSLPAFTGIDLKISAQVFIRQGDQQSVSVEGKQDLIDELELDIQNGVWDIEFDRCVRDLGSMKIFITVPDVSSLAISGSGDIISENTMVVGDIELKISGSGTIDVGLEADDINARISGSGVISMEGVGDVLDLNISGSGDLNAFGMTLRVADINISGSGDAEVFVTDSLLVRISGSGDVFYKGNPAVDVSISGSGRVVDAN